MKGLIIVCLFFILLPFSALAQQRLKTDIIKTSAGALAITFVGHGSLVFLFDGKIIHIDPTSMVGDYSKMPKADMVLITHEHRDHFDPKALEYITTAQTPIVCNPAVAAKVKNSITMKNGDTIKLEGLIIEAIPAYNIVHMRRAGTPFHPKGVGNGYVVTFGNKRVYIAGDTENIPEMKALERIDIAFLPMNLPYTMTPEMVADAATAFRPKILYPYHYGETDTAKIIDLLKNEQIEIRIRDME